MAASDTIRIVLVDDEQMVRSGLRMILESEDGFEVVGEAGDGAAAVEQVKRLDPDVVLMDIHRPEMGGIEATRRIVAELPATFVILCSTYDVHDLPPDAATSGARAYVHKEQLGAKTLRRLWDQRESVDFAS